MNKILITGASGFVGSAVLRRLAADGMYPTAVVRRADTSLAVQVDRTVVNDINAETDWSAALQGHDAVIHCAARVHVMNDRDADPLDAFRAVNVAGTLNLARQAVRAGVRRFLFVSSIGVNGAETAPGKPFTASSPAAPHSPYAVSKLEAEEGLLEIAREAALEVVIIRPPLVYGPGAPGNFGSLVRWVGRGMPLPLGAVHNRRSYVALDNLVDLIVTALTHPAAAGHVFLASDGEDLSTTELLRRTGRVLGHRTWLLPVPAAWLNLAAACVGKSDVAQRLCGSLQVDIEETRKVLGWVPPLTVDQGLQRLISSD